MSEFRFNILVSQLEAGGFESCEVGAKGINIKKTVID